MEVDDLFILDTVPRRVMPLIFLVDKSESMGGKKNASLNDVIREVLNDIGEISRNNSDTLIKIAVLEFADIASWMYPQPVDSDIFMWNEIQAGGLSNFGAALSELNNKLSESHGFLTEPTGSRAPAIILLSDGDFSDNYKYSLKKIKTNPWFKVAIKIAIAVGNDAKINILTDFTGNAESVITIHSINTLKMLIHTISVTASQLQLESLSSSIDEKELPTGVNVADVQVRESITNDKELEPTFGKNDLGVCATDSSVDVWDDWDDIIPNEKVPSCKPGYGSTDWDDSDLFGTEQKGSWFGSFTFEEKIKKVYNHEPIVWDCSAHSRTTRKESFLSRIFGNKKKPQLVYSSVFAPAEIAPKHKMMIQVYLHLKEETDNIKKLASEADKNTERRGYEPLEIMLKNGDNVEIELNINGKTLLYNSRKSVTWQGSYTKRSFDYLIPSDIDVYELSCSVNIFVNGAIAGEMIFITNIVDAPRTMNTNIIAKPIKKLFISYSHKDVKSAERIAKIHEALGIDVFFDKHRLKAGYIYSEEISRFIQTADTFVLCWSENAAGSEYVEKERQEALALAYPQCQPREYASLKIHPYNIEPHAAPPADMIEHYHFEEL